MKTVSGAFGAKPAFELIRQWHDEHGVHHVEYYAGFWNGRSYDRVKCHDSAPNGARWANVSPGVSYYDKMPKVVDRRVK